MTLGVRVFCEIIEADGAKRSAFIADPWWLQFIFVLFTKIGSSCGSAVNYVQLSELYPTKIRTLATGFTITIGRIGAILAPFTKETGVVIGPWAPKSIDCFCCIACALLGLLLPETFKMALPDTVQDAKSRSIKKEKVAVLPETVTLQNGQECKS